MHSATTWILSTTQPRLHRRAHPDARTQARAKNFCHMTLVFTLSSVHSRSRMHPAQEQIRTYIICPFQLHLLPTFFFLHDLLNRYRLIPKQQSGPCPGLKAWQFLVDALRVRPISVLKLVSRFFNTSLPPLLHVGAPCLTNIAWKVSTKGKPGTSCQKQNSGSLC